VPMAVSLRAHNSRSALLWLGPASTAIRFGWFPFIAAGCLGWWTPHPVLLSCLLRSFNARMEVVGSLLQAFASPVGACSDIMWRSSDAWHSDYLFRAATPHA
jgi:hypothetical protein